MIVIRGMAGEEVVQGSTKRFRNTSPILPLFHVTLTCLHHERNSFSSSTRILTVLALTITFLSSTHSTMPVIFKFEPIPGPTADWEDTELYVRVANIFCLICGYWNLKPPNLAHIIPRKHGKSKKAVGSHTTKPNWEDTFRLS